MKIKIIAVGVSNVQANLCVIFSQYTSVENVDTFDLQNTVLLAVHLVKT
jgi:hypothetical protein